MITGTPAFYDGPQGVPRLPPLAQRLATDFATDPRFDNPRAVQIRLPGFDLRRAAGARRARSATCTRPAPRRRDRIARPGRRRLRRRPRRRGRPATLGGKVGVAPRVFLKKLVADVLDRVDQFADFDPRRHYALTLAASELTEVERNAAAWPAAAARADDIDLDL